MRLKKTGLNFYLIAFLIIFVSGLFLANDKNIFWSVFFASFLGLLGSFITQSWIEARSNKGNARHAFIVLCKEIEHNLTLIQKIKDHVNNCRSISTQDFNDRKDPIFYRLVITSKNSLWDKITEYVLDEIYLQKVIELYSDYEQINRQLDSICDFVLKRITPGSMYDDYIQAVDHNLWSVQFNNTLVKAITRTNEIMIELKQISNE